MQDAGIKTWLFGGWAEEVLGLGPPRLHHDLDLLYPARDFTAVDALLATGRGLAEIAVKRLPHKRAFLRLGVMTELILVRTVPRPSYITCFWDQVHYRWPADLLTAETGGLRVASADAIRQYRADHDRIHPAMISPWTDGGVLTGGQYRTAANLAARQSAYAFQRPRIDLPATVLELARLDGTEMVVDIGCGNGAYLAQLSRRGHGGRAIGVDLSAGMLEAARGAAPGARVLRGDAARLPLADGCADVALAPHMLYHVPNPPAAIAEMRHHRRGRPGARGAERHRPPAGTAEPGLRGDRSGADRGLGGAVAAGGGREDAEIGVRPRGTP